MKFWSKLIALSFAITLLAWFTSATAHADDGSIPCNESKVTGCVLATLDGVSVRFNGYDPYADSGDYEYGTRWQCVELIQRYYAEIYGYAKIWAPSAAYQIFDDGGHPSTMAAFPNGSSTVPRKGDILVFDSTPYNLYGHVAIVKSVDFGNVTFVQQNYSDLGEDSLPIDANNVIDSQGRYGPVRGWLRDTSTVRDTLSARATATAGQ